MMQESKPDSIEALSRHKDEKFCCDGSSPDDIFVTGMTGRFPSTDNVRDLKDRLYNKHKFLVVTENRWKAGTLGLPLAEYGNVNDLSKLDADFFQIPYVTCNSIEPMQRVVLEVSYEAIADSGYNPFDFRGKAVGVYTAVTQSDLRELLTRNYDITEADFAGFLNALTANRISYCLDLKGPSFLLDAAWSSSSSALDQAIKDLKDGRIDGAVVCGAQVCINPELTSNCILYGSCAIGKPSCPFDAKASGMMRTETIAAVFLQKASSARRCYAKIMNLICQTRGYIPEGLYFQSKDHLKELYVDVLKGSGLKPNDICYVEAHGFGIRSEDAVELNSLTDIYCKDRKEPLLVGSVKSNIGNTEGAASLCGLIKCILALDNGLISPNLNYEEPNPECPCLLDGTVQVVTEATELSSPYVAVNNLGLGGLNCQMILKMNTIDPTDRQKALPQCLLYSATTEEAVKYVINNVTSEKYPNEFISITNNLAFTPIRSKPYRGYAVLSENPVSEVELCLEEKREVWFILTGMGCQWPGMGASLMEIDIFANSVRRSAKVLEPLGIDLLELLSPHTNQLLEHRRITRAFVTICAIQIALVDILRELGIEPDGMLGHSTGELVCAYADGCCTAEQTILSAYFRGKAVEMSNLPDGAMAAVGMSWEEAKSVCPDNVYPACHNAEDSITISGLVEPLKSFVAKLEKEGRFARVVDAYGYSFHCSEIAVAAPLLKSELERVITDPKPRSKRWLSTSYSPDLWDKPEANIADASYFSHNLTSTVHFAEALTYIPTNAITIEIGPHFLLQSILKRVIGNNASYLGMMKRHESNINFMLTTIGKMYKLGLNPKINCLYPPPRYPVPRGVPSISSLLKWNHSTSWNVPSYLKFDHDIMSSLELDERERYFLDYKVGGRILCPAMGYLLLTWKTLADKLDRRLSEFPIAVEDFRIHKVTTLSINEKKVLRVRISNTREMFEIFDENDLVASGKLALLSELVFQPPAPSYKAVPTSEMIPAEDYYKELKIRGYEYGPQFKELVEIDVNGTQGLVKWTENWVSFLHAHLLFFEFSHDQTLSLPTGAFSIKIDPQKVLSGFNDSVSQGLNGLPVTFEKYIQRCCSSGIEIRKATFESIDMLPLIDNPPILEECNFVPYNQICAIPDDVRQKYVEYVNVCSKVASKVAFSVDQPLAKKLETCVTSDIKPETIENYLKTQDKDYILLQILNELSESGVNLKSENTIFEKYLKNIIGSDLLYRTLFDTHPLRSILEIIVENTSNSLNVVEVFNGCFTTLDLINSVMKKYYNRKLNSLLLCEESHYVDASALKEVDIEVQIFQKREDCLLQDQDIIIGSFLFGDAKAFQSDLEFLCSLSRKGSYILLYHKTFVSPSEAFLSYLYGEALKTLSESDVQAIFKKMHLSIIAKKSDSLGSTLYLLRYGSVNLSSSSDIVVKIQDGNYKEWIDQLKLSMLSASGRVWLVADESSTNGVVGLAKCLKTEPGGEKIRCVYVFKDEKLKSIPTFDLKNPFYAEVAERDILMNIYRNGAWGAFSHFEISIGDEEKFIEHSYVKCSKRGDLGSLEWIESPISCELEVEKLQNIIYVCYSALNFKDVMIATKKIPPRITEDKFENIKSDELGFEFSGVTADGRRLMGLTPCRGISTTIQLDRSITFDVPEKWTLEEAATVPFVYCTCYYALIVRAQLLQKQTVLISSEAEDIKIAAIRIALSLDCKIYVVVHSDKRKQYLKEKFPQVNEIDVDLPEFSTIDDFISKDTEGQGVDIVLNSNNDHENILACTRCLAENGRFFNISKYGLERNHPLGLNMFLSHVSFNAVFFENLLRPENLQSRTLNQVTELFNEGLKSDVVQPFERILFERDDVEGAFRHMVTRNYTGKVVLKIRDDPKKGMIPLPLKAKLKPAAYFHKHKTYIVVGGLGDFGIELTKWLLQNGASNIIITSRQGARTAYHHLSQLRWRNMGANVEVHTLDASEKGNAIQLLKAASSIGPVGGIFNCAVVLHDAFIENQTARYFVDATAAKNLTSKHLDELSRVMCPQLDYFVCFSSISSGKGIAGQSNDGYANSSMERICENRRRDGLHGLAMQLGPIADIGVIHRRIGEEALLSGIAPQKVQSCLSTLEHFLQLSRPVLCSYVIAKEKQPTMKQKDLLPQLEKILGISNISEVNRTLTLKEIGVNLLAGSELQNFLEFSYGITHPTENLMRMSINDLLVLVEQKKSKSQVEDKKREFVPAKLSIPKNQFSSSPILSLNTGKTGTPIFLIHPLEMELLKLEPLTRQVSAPVYGLFVSNGISSDNMLSIAMSHLKEIRKYSTKFHLMGYAVGSCLAFEIALQSQNNYNLPSVKNAIFLDGSSYLTEAFLSDQKTDVPPTIDAADLYDYLMQFSSLEIPMVKEELIRKLDSESRLFYTMKQVCASGSKDITKDNIFAGIRLYKKILEFSRAYRPKTKLISNLTFLESPGKLFPNDVASVKFAVAKFCSGKIDIHRIPSGKQGANGIGTSTVKANLINVILDTDKK